MGSSQVQQHGYEGLVAKDPWSLYDRQRTCWLKVKVRHEGRFVFGGAIQRDGLQALLVGRRESGRLHFVDTAEFGVGRRTVEAIFEQAKVLMLASSPFVDYSPARDLSMHWLEPRITAALTYSEVMQGRLRDPVSRGFASGYRAT